VPRRTPALRRRERALELCARALLIEPGAPGTLYNVACAYALLDENDKALDLVEKWVETGAGGNWIREDPGLQETEGQRRASPRCSSVSRSGRRPAGDLHESRRDGSLHWRRPRPAAAGSVACCSSSSAPRSCSPRSSRTMPLTWLLEVLPVLIAVPLMIATYRRFPLTPLLYVLIALHALVLIVGGHYTYARVPLGFLDAGLVRPRTQSLRPHRSFHAGVRAGDRRTRTVAAHDTAAARRVAVHRS
jgi:hypothetical protein